MTLKLLSRFSIVLVVILYVGSTVGCAGQVFVPTPTPTAAITATATSTKTSVPTATTSLAPEQSPTATLAPVPTSALSNRDCRQVAGREADYILSCQDFNPADPAYGAINNVYGDPTRVVPSEVAMAALGLDLASDTLDDPSYRSRAQLALDYLIKVQQPDGSWYNQYSYMDPHGDLGKSPHQTAEVMVALYKLDHYPSGYDAMRKGARYLLDCQNVANKGGNDDGLLGAGKNPEGQFQSWRWTHDNAYAYWALRAAELWAVRAGETSLASTYAASAQRILEGINTYLYEPGTGTWHIAIDANGNPQWFSDLANLPSWIQYAPQMLDLPASGVNSPRVGEWIHGAFQQGDGSCTGYSWDGELKVRKYPGLSFQAALSWFDTGNTAYANAAFDWALGSGLWQTTPDEHGITGSWIDWVEGSPNPGTKAPGWQRFIDTSFYAIAACSGGYDFRIP